MSVRPIHDRPARVYDNPRAGGLPLMHGIDPLGKVHKGTPVVPVEGAMLQLDPWQAACHKARSEVSLMGTPKANAAPTDGHCGRSTKCEHSDGECRSERIAALEAAYQELMSSFEEEARAGAMVRWKQSEADQFTAFLEGVRRDHEAIALRL